MEEQPAASPKGGVQEQLDAGLNRRGNAFLRRDLEEARRIYNPQDQQEWGTKYRTFSGDHMRRAYERYAQARHDPFNKTPAWGSTVVRKIGQKMLASGLTPEEEFAKLDLSKDGLLQRAEVRRLFLETVPELGDTEITAVFSLLDTDNDGTISLDELTKVFPRTKSSSGSPTKSSSQWRGSSSGEAGTSTEAIQQQSSSKGLGAVNDSDDGDPVNHRTPVHRVKRLPPAVIEGWDHLQGDVKHKLERDLLKDRGDQMFKRLGAQLSLSPRAAIQTPSTEYSKYNHFGGGCDAGRFQKNLLRKELRDRDSDGVSSVSAAVSSIPDPGGLDLRPGYHVELTRLCPQYGSPSTRRQRLTPRAGTSASGASQRPS